jgi:NCAIR mutase (PurE)-related protein
VSPDALRALLEQVARQETSVDGALAALQTLPFEDLGFANVDHHRALRTGVPEVVWGPGKTDAQIAAILGAIAARGQTALVTRVEPERAARIVPMLPEAVRDAAVIEAVPRFLRVGPEAPRAGRGYVAVVAAGTADLPVAELLGVEARRIVDVGVAGLHRLLARRAEIEGAEVVVCVAGMEAALPSVLKGLVSRPMVGVPTSIGTGTHFGGVAALLSMLNACSTGMTTVNIDNGFGAGYFAALVCKDRARA